MAVTAADPSGLWGLLKELFAGGTALTKAITGADTNGLVKALVTDFCSSQGRSDAQEGLRARFGSQQPSDIKRKAIDALRQVSALLDAKASEDAAAFKAWLRQISQSTEEAASEGGGLFGIGGVKVSEAEKATLAETSTALGSYSGAKCPRRVRPIRTLGNASHSGSMEESLAKRFPGLRGPGSPFSSLRHS
jgi:hypothetical protein